MVIPLNSLRGYTDSLACDCGWRIHADVNGAANLFREAYKVSPVARRRSSGDVATPVVVPIRLGWHTVHEPMSPVA